MKRLKSGEINYLAFEGGGGSGNVYPGALKALDKLGILAYDPQRAGLAPEVSLAGSITGIDWVLRGQVQGVSGASAGAINALFLALGYTPGEVEYILTSPANDFEAFFDEITPGLNPHVGGFRQDYTDLDLSDFAEQFSATPGGKIFNALTSYGPYRLLEFHDWLATIRGQFIATTLVSYLGVFAEFPARALDQVIANVIDSGATQASLVHDFGIFPGLTIRQFFARYISLAVERILRDDPSYALKDTDAGAYGPSATVNAGYGRSFYDTQTKQDVRTSEITFRQHQQIFGTRLVVTGTNLETEKSHLFSAATTPNFRVVDAVRISMSLPLLFKPMAIRDDADLKAVINSGDSLTNHPLKGLWVDGGLFNNIPVAAFDEEVGDQTHTLGMMVGSEGRSEIDSLTGFLSVYPFGLGVFGTGGSQVSSTTQTVDRIIILSTTELITGEEIGLLDFKVDPKIYSAINEQSRKTVEEFFHTRVD